LLVRRLAVLSVATIMSADDDYTNFYDDVSAPHHATNTDHTRNSPSRLTGYDPDFLDRILPPYEPSDYYNPFFTEAPTADHYRPSPSPQAPAFFDHILNPAGLDHGRYSPFAYRPDLPTQDMPPTTRARPHASERPARLPNGYLDLTATPDSPPQSQRRKRESPTPGPSAKRQKREDGTAAAARQHSAEPAKVEEVDLTDDKNPVQEVLQKQREDAVKAQAKPEETVTTFNSFNCVICMDNPTDLTATTCGKNMDILGQPSHY
jgi:hypothetical protein